jgi:hypothetical protein
LEIDSVPGSVLPQATKVAMRRNEAARDFANMVKAPSG